MEVCRALPCHIPDILRLLRQVGQVHHEIRPDIFRVGALKYDENQLCVLLKDETRPIFVALADGHVLGYCFCVQKDYRSSGVQTDRVEVYIDDLCVDEACRGQGVASVLYRYVAAYARALGCSFISLNLWCGNENALRFYEHIMMEQPLEDL